MIVGQLDPAAGGVIAYIGTFVVATVFYGVTLHIAARYVLGSVPIKGAFTVAPVLAFASILLQQAGPALVAVVMVPLAAFAIHLVYDLGYKLTALVVVIYYTVALLVGLTLFNLVQLLGTAPG